MEWLQPGPRSVWPHLWLTLQATLVGLVVGVGSGFLVGMTLSRSRFLADVFNPFIVAFNSMPRIAFVPLITMFFGLGLASKVVTSWFVVFFLVFFNTYKGGRSVERELVDFCRTLGGSPRQILWRVRIPTAAAWTFAALPNAISFALIGVVLAEFVGSTTGMGYLMITALATLNATDMFAAVTLLSIVGIALVYCVTGWNGGCCTGRPNSANEPSRNHDDFLALSAQLRPERPCRAGDRLGPRAGLLYRPRAGRQRRAC